VRGTEHRHAREHTRDSLSTHTDDSTVGLQTTLFAGAALELPGSVCGCAAEAATVDAERRRSAGAMRPKVTEKFRELLRLVQFPPRIYPTPAWLEAVLSRCASLAARFGEAHLPQRPTLSGAIAMRLK